MSVSRRLSAMRIQAFAQPLPVLLPVWFLSVRRMALHRIRPLFEAPLQDPHHVADSSAELTLTGLRAKCPLDIAFFFWQRMEGASSLTVSLCMRVLSAATDSAPPLLARRHASEGLSQHLTLRSKKSGPHAHPPGSPGSHASPHPLRWQNASSWRTRLIPRESGGSRTFRRAPVVTRSLWSYARS